MKVAILGAPGTGKSELAQRMARSLNRDKTEFRWTVIDGYVEDLTRRTGRVYGIEADIPHNAQVMAERWTREAEAVNKGLSTITCGSIYETMVYTALTRLVPPADEQELVQFMHEARISMQFFGLMEQLTFNYDVLFFLPLAPDQHNWPAVIDAKLPEVLEGAFRYAVPLTGTTRQKVTHALAVVRSIRDLLLVVEAEAPSDQ